MQKKTKLPYKIKWEVSEPATGRYRSFDRRGWPTANYNDINKSYCASIECDDEYIPRNLSTGNHAPLKLLIADYSKGSEPGLWKRTVWKPAAFANSNGFKTLQEAKDALQRILFNNPHMLPPHLREQSTTVLVNFSSGRTS